MFTGLIQHVGTVVSCDENDFGRRLVVDTAGWGHAPADGASIAVDGCCLTVAARDDGLLMFDVVRQTLRMTTLGTLGTSSRVNLEHAVTPATLMGGHVVQGHVDGTAAIIEVVRADECRLRIEPPVDLLETIVLRGSIAVAGVSLTVAALDDGRFEVALVPTTLERTTLGGLVVGDRVNLETDYLVKAVVGWLERRGG